MSQTNDRNRNKALARDVLASLWRGIRMIIIYCLAAGILFLSIWAGVRFVSENYLAPASTDDHSAVLIEIPKGSGKSRIASILAEQNLIRSETVFKLYIDIFGYASKLKAGSYILNPTMSYKEILDKISRSGGNATVTDFIVIEGYSIVNMADRLLADGHISGKEVFLKTCGETGNFNGIGIISEMNETVPEEKLKARKYLLEGYLFPAKYEIYVTATEEDIVRKMAVKMNSLFNDERRAKADALNMSVDDVLTLASIIEKESRPDDFARVSAVFHNRLNRGMKLQSCATLQYALGIKRIVLTSEDTSSDSLYNTYMYSGLPVGPICAPSEKAIDAALNPDEDYLRDGYLYFVTKDPKSGELEFNIDEASHSAAAERYRPLWEEWDRNNAQ